MVDAARNRLRAMEPLLLKPVSYGKRTGSVMTEHSDRLVFIELLEGAARDLVHGHQFGAFDVGGLKFPGLTHIQQQGRVVGRELLF